MAFASAFSTVSLQFRPISSSGEKPNSQRASGRNGKPRNLKSRKQRPAPRYLSAVEGGEAATYTRLPPKEDFDFLNFESDSDIEVIKFQDLVKPASVQSKRHVQKVAEIDVEKKGNGEEIKWEGYYDGEIEEDDETIGYRGEIDERFEFYEVGSDDEYGDGDFLDGDDDSKELKSEQINEEEEIQEKEKGLPAVMRCFDRAKIYVKAGDGGNGVVAFRREKFVPLGGPSGGDGGRGGHVYMEVDGAMNSLLSFRKSVHFRAGRGSHGQGQQKNGAKGESVVVKVPPGTVVRESGGEVLLELLHPGQKALLLPGGRGGRGNASFKTRMNKAPKIAENGEEGPEMWLDLELKLVADVGIIGAPNAGKSTFLSVISAAQPTIADYPFTTLLPNLGVVSFDYDASIVVADLPGLLEGAHRGFGLGHEFLRHTERCSVLVHIVDGSSQQPVYEFDAVRLELEMFNPELAKKPYIVAFNKMDLPEASENWESFKQTLRSYRIEAFSMSAATRNGTQEVINFAYNLLRSSSTDDKEGIDEPENLNHVAEIMQKQRATPINEFQISHDSSTDTFHVLGAGLERFVQMTNWRYEDSERRFQHVLEACGVHRSLKKLGVKEGDTVIIAGMELVWSDTDNGGTRSRSKWASEPVE